MNFGAFVVQDQAKLALILNAIDPACGGVLLVGAKGCGKSTLARLSKELLDEGAPFVEVPQNATEDALLGGIDLELTARTGRRCSRAGLLARADGGVLHIDDINLLSPEIAALVMEAQARGQVLLDREGLSRVADARFSLIASLNPDEGQLGPHLLDRFGLCALFEDVKDRDERLAILRLGVGLNAAAAEDFRPRIALARARLSGIAVPDAVRELISEIGLKYCISGHRGEICLYYAARAYAAWQGLAVVGQDEVEAVVQLVLAHRARELTPPEQDSEAPRPPEQEPEDQNDEQDEQDDQPDEQPDDNQPPPQDLNPDQPETEPDQDAHDQQEANPLEAVFATGQDFKIRRLVFKKDRVKRLASGRRTKTQSKDKGGRYVKSTLRDNKDVAIDATLRAAAPMQGLRPKLEGLNIQDEDLRFKKREKRMGHLTIFVVDGSGSMGANQRMIETKGAIMSLLSDCYRRRDKVALIVFRKDRAEMVLQPTSSVAFAARSLRELPVGGKTPLAAGLLEAYRLIETTARKAPETRCLLTVITDGRANAGLGAAKIREEVQQLAGRLAQLKGLDALVIDTEDKRGLLKLHLARSLAQDLGADYYTPDELKADYLQDVVRQNLATLEV